MTAIRDRQSDPDADEVAVPWDVRPVVGARRGLPWWGAVLLALGVAVVGATADMQLRHSLGWLFDSFYFVGSVAAICAVQRRSLFGPMVQPPLILALTVPSVVLLVSGLPASSDTLAKALAVGTPLINGFPTMAITTGFTLAIGILRLYRERDPKAPVKGPKGAGSAPGSAHGKRPPSQGRARGAGSRSGAPVREGVPEREGVVGREGAVPRGRRPADGRTQAQRAAAGEPHPSLPMTRRPRPDDPPRRSEPGARGGEPGRPGEPGRGGDPGRGDPGVRGGRRTRGSEPRARRGDPGGRGGAPGGGDPGARGGDPGLRGGEPGRSGDPGPREPGIRGGEPGERGGKKPPPARRPRPPRGGAPEEDDRRREGRSGGTPRADRPRRMPPRSDDPGDGQGLPRAPGRGGGPPPRRRPWDDEA